MVMTYEVWRWRKMAEATKFSGIQFRWLPIPSNSSHPLLPSNICSILVCKITLLRKLGENTERRFPCPPIFCNSRHFQSFWYALGAVFMQTMWSWGHLGSWHWEDEDIGPTGQGANESNLKRMKFIMFYWHSFYQQGVHTHHVQEEELQHPKRRRGGVPGTWKNPQRGRWRRRCQWHLWELRRFPFNQVFKVVLFSENSHGTIFQGDTQSSQKLKPKEVIGQTRRNRGETYICVCS